jgi:hypothetical protein
VPSTKLTSRARVAAILKASKEYPQFSRVLSASDSADVGAVCRSQFQRVLEYQRKLLNELEVCQERLTKAESTFCQLDLKQLQRLQTLPHRQTAASRDNMKKISHVRLDTTPVNSVTRKVTGLEKAR